MKKVHITLNKEVIHNEEFLDYAVKMLTTRYEISNVNEDRVKSLKILSGDIDVSKLPELQEDSLVTSISEDNEKHILN